MDQPILRPLAETEEKIVRVNSGGDSNIHRNYVIESTAPYEHKFYNTSIPVFDFPGPVVFTCNARTVDTGFYAATDVDNLMAVRVLVNTWNPDVVNKAVDWYVGLGVPVLLTFMRYRSRSSVHPMYYEFKEHVSNGYYMIKPEPFDRIVRDYIMRYDTDIIRTCGTSSSHLCKNCRNCAALYGVFMATCKY